MTATGALNRRLATNLDDTFPVFLEEMHGLVFNAARRWLPSHQDAEDVTQEVFVRAYRALLEYEPDRIREMRLRPWLFTVTVNLCRNHARTQGRRPRQQQFEDSHDRRVTAPGAEDAAVSAVVVDEWRARLARLQPRQRDAIVLRHVVGLGYAEISEVLERPPGTVKSDVHRGLAKLRQILATEESQ